MRTLNICSRASSRASGERATPLRSPPAPPLIASVNHRRVSSRSEEEKGRLYTEEEVGWIFDTEPVFVRLSWKQKVLLRKIVTLVSFADLPEGTEAQDIADLLEEIDFPHRFGR